MVMRSIKKMIGPHKRANPHKRMPEEYHKAIWLPKKLYQDIEMLAEFEKKSVRKTGIEMLEFAVKAYIEPRIAEENQARMLIQKGLLPYKPPGPFIKFMRKYMEEHGIKNPRIDEGYKVI